MNRSTEQIPAIDVVNSRWFWLLLGIANVAAGVMIALRPMQSRDVQTVAHWCRQWLIDGINPYPGVAFSTNYPPYALVFLSPLAILSGGLLKLTWALVGAGLALLIGWLGLKSTSDFARGSQPALLSVGFFLAWESLRVGLGLGQFTLVAFAGGLAATVTPQTFTRGILLAIAMIKPQVGAAFVLWGMLTGAWTALAVAAGVMAIATIVFAARVGQSPFDVTAIYADVLRHQASGVSFRQGALELRPLIHDVINQTALADTMHGLFVVGTLALIVLAFRRMSVSNRQLFVLPLTCVWTLMSVYHSTYDLVLAWPALVAVTAWTVHARPGLLARAGVWAVQAALLVDIPGLWWKLSGRPVSPAPGDLIGGAIQHLDRLLVLGLFAGVLAISTRWHPAVLESAALSRNAVPVS